MSNALWVAVMPDLAGLPGKILNLAMTPSSAPQRDELKAAWLLVTATALIAANLACGSTGPSATANNPPTLTPTTAAATQSSIPRPTAQPTAPPLTLT